MQSLSAAAAAVAEAELQQQHQQQQLLQEAAASAGPEQDNSYSSAAADGLYHQQDAEAMFAAAEAEDAFAYNRPVRFAARGRSVSLRQMSHELSRQSMPLPQLARNRSMGSIALPSPPAAAAAAAWGSLARSSVGLCRSSMSLSRRSSSAAAGGVLEQQLARSSWLPRQGTGLFQGSPGR
jgi:hypothetical protein